jgi:hypothetical protein
LKSKSETSADVIACDKREAFAQVSNATKQSIARFPAAPWIASLPLAMTLHGGERHRGRMVRNAVNALSPEAKCIVAIVPVTKFALM